MYIQKLKNPKTESYQDLKKIILSDVFPWFWYSQSIFNPYNEQIYKNIPFYSHCFLKRSEASGFRIPVVNSDIIEHVCRVLIEIIECNNMQINSFLRINANCVHPSNTIENSVPHTDHLREHKNLLIYLTNAGGKIFVNNEFHDPKEDDAICFNGLEHYMQTPKENRRICLIATFV